MIFTFSEKEPRIFGVSSATACLFIWNKKIYSKKKEEIIEIFPFPLFPFWWYFLFKLYNLNSYNSCHRYEIFKWYTIYTALLVFKTFRIIMYIIYLYNVQKTKWATIKQHNFIGIRAFDSRLYLIFQGLFNEKNRLFLDISRSFKCPKCSPVVCLIC